MRGGVKMSKKPIPQTVWGTISSKGGTGKSTMCRTGSVVLPFPEGSNNAIIDCDPQGTSARFVRQRLVKYPDLSSPDISAVGGELVKEKVTEYLKNGITNIICDTPPVHRAQKPVHEVASISDIVIIVSKMSEDDMIELPQSIQIARNYNKPFVLVMTMSQPNTNFFKFADKKMKAIANKYGGYYCPHTIRQSVTHLEASLMNKTATEFAPRSEAAKDIMNVWKHLWAIAKKEREGKLLDV